jgi:hypothetical protein
MELAVDSDSDAHEEDRSVEDNEVEAELQVEKEKASVGDKLIWGLQQHACRSRRGPH